MARNYKQEYERYQGTPEQIHNRSLRNKARRAAVKAGQAKKGDGKDVGHILALSKGGSNSAGNTRMQSRPSNRAFARNADGSIKAERSRSGK